MTARFSKSISESASGSLSTRGREGFLFGAHKHAATQVFALDQTAVYALLNAPEIRRLRKFIGRAFILWLAALCIDYYIHDSGWYPQQWEVAVFFNHGDWIEGEIRTCYSILFNGEFFGIDCSPETQEIKRDGIFRYSPENHVLPVRFWGSLKADTDKLWKCERFQTTMTCKLQ